jgi:hypothetical protein
LIHGPGPVGTGQVAFQSLSTKHQSIIQSGLLLNGQGDGDGAVHRVRVVWFLRILQATPHPEGGRCASSEIGADIGHHIIQFDTIDLGRIKLNAVLCLSHTILIVEHIYQLFIIRKSTGKVIKSFIILNPERNIPGFVICPPVVGLVDDFGLESCSGHRVGFVWFLIILQATRPPRGGRCASCSTVLGFLLGGIRCDRLQDLQEFLTIRGTIQQSRCNFESHNKM